MKHQFYSHIIDTDEIHQELSVLELEDEEKNELVVIMESSIHHLVMDTVLSELSEDEKKVFLLHVHKKEHENTWQFLKAKIHAVEDKIRSAVQSLVHELKGDIHEAKSLKDTE